MFPRLALLPIGLFLIWCFVVSRWYVCHIKQLCGEPTVVIDEPPPPPPDERPLVFKWADDTPITRSSFEAFKKGQLDGLGEGQLLEITGCYYKDEATPEGFSNMGLARAAKIKALFIPPLTAEQIVENSKLIDPEPDGIRADTLFEAALFRYRTPTKDPVVECIVENNNSLTVLFPYGKAQREVDTKIEECLQNLIEAMKQTDDNALIVGHTDDAGSDRFNFGLGMRRAEHIKGILVKNGIAGSRISTESRGEKEPVASNDTEEGTRQNRRAVLTLVKK
ncbi:MAG: OmpA family protein [Saprospiraceae bacterium]|jgi:outer membrane protein OmpA-like peptidoglycan-associated protein